MKRIIEKKKGQYIEASY